MLEQIATLQLQFLGEVKNLKEPYLFLIIICIQ